MLMLNTQAMATHFLLTAMQERGEDAEGDMHHEAVHPCESKHLQGLKELSGLSVTITSLSLLFIPT